MNVLRDPKIAALSLHYLNSAIQVTIFIFANALFLASYPPSWLIYFFIGQAIIDIIISYLLTPLLSKNSRIYPTSILMAIAAITTLFIFLDTYHLYFLPLGFSLFLMSVGLLSNIMSWNCTRSAFDVLEFKELSPSISTVQAISNILTSLLLAFYLKFYTIHFLSYLCLIMLVLSALLTYQLIPLPAIEKKLKKGSKPLKYDLYKRLFTIVFIIAIIYTLIDYCLKYQLSISLPKAQFGEFMANFSLLASILAFIFNSIAMRFAIAHFGIASLLTVLPLYWFVTSLAAGLYTTLATVVAMAAGKYIFYYSSFSAGRELALNVLPRAIRVSGQFLLKSLASPLAGGMAALFLFFFADHISLTFIIAMIAIMSGCLTFYARRLQTSYTNTLKDAIHLQRFDLGDVTNKKNLALLQDIALQALEKDDPSLGFALLPNLKLSTLPNQVFKHLDSQDPDIRIYAAQIISLFNAKEALPYLLKRVQVEQNPDVRWWILNTAAEIDAVNILPLGKKLVDSTYPESKAAAIKILLYAGDENEKKLALDKIIEIMQSDNTENRKYAAYLFRYLSGTKSVLKLSTLITDNNRSVSNFAIESAAKLKSKELIPDIIHRASEAHVYLSAQKSLLEYGDYAVPLLKNSIMQLQNDTTNKFKYLVNILSTFPNESAKLALIDLVNTANIQLKQIIAKEFSYHAQKNLITNSCLLQLENIIFNEYKLIVHLKKILHQYKQSEIKHEINVRINMAKHRLFYWLASYSNPDEVMSLFTLVFNRPKQEQANAIELLISIVNQSKFTNIIMDAFLDKNSSQHVRVDEQISDNWLIKVINHVTTSEKKGRLMDNMQKVFTLRKVDLFKNLPGETLLVIAAETETVDMFAGETIFSAGDPPTGLYIIASGSVDITKDNKILTTLHENSFFGELALLDNATRSSNAIAKTDGLLLFLEKETFDRITEDLPDVLRSLIQSVLGYLRKNMSA